MTLDGTKLKSYLLNFLKFHSGDFAVSSTGGSTINVRLLRRSQSLSDVAFPWKPTVRSSGTEIDVIGGTVNAEVVAAAEALPLTGSGEEFVWLEVTCTLSLYGTFVNSFTITAAAIDAGTTTPTDDETAGDYYIPLIRLFDGIVTDQYRNTSFGFRVVDNGTASGSARAEYWSN